jgi:hypothetical protein
MSADTFREHILVPNWILELRSKKNKTQGQNQSGAGYEIQLFNIKPNIKGICAGKKKKKIHASH